jgi:NTE family protein
VCSSFDGLKDDALRECMESLPTSFALPVPTVTLLRQVARELLESSSEFGKLMQALDRNWKPKRSTIDAGLRAQVCGSGGGR